jgi:hypothetical protein
MANFKSINNQGSCASLSDLYTKAKSANSITGTLDSSNVVDLDGLMGKLTNIICLTLFYLNYILILRWSNSK